MMNFTRDTQKQMGLWTSLATVSFAPSYPSSIRVNNDQREDSPGTR